MLSRSLLEFRMDSFASLGVQTCQCTDDPCNSSAFFLLLIILIYKKCILRGHMTWAFWEAPQCLSGARRWLYPEASAGAALRVTKQGRGVAPHDLRMNLTMTRFTPTNFQKVMVPMVPMLPHLQCLSLCSFRRFFPSQQSTICLSTKARIYYGYVCLEIHWWEGFGTLTLNIGRSNAVSLRHYIM